ncbi:DUF5805 domain-containing protein [Halosimplex sp. TS25]|uniref:DUF5805 domain-containing protein n=1 Tax=Halosimplex rarum TaxID=3396619 RepID=UPI0039E9890F
MAESDVDTSRVSVRTYVPTYQRSEWDDHADELGMSRSEFVRTMVQAGRRGFGGSKTGPTVSETDDPESESEESPAAPSPDADPQGTGLEDRVVSVLRSAEYLSWDELLDAVTDDIEAELESTLQDLQSSGRVTYSGRNGGYTIDE